MLKVDLHCHTTASDGSLTPFEIIDLAVKHEIKVLAITDHDTTAGYELVKDYAFENDVQLIPGVEISCHWLGNTIHVVALDFAVDNTILQQGLEKIRQARVIRAQLMLQRFNAKPHEKLNNLDDDLWQLVGDGVVGRGHFAQLLQQRGIVKTGAQAFSRYLKKGKIGFVPSDWPEIADIVSWINQAGGVAVIAHPNVYRFTSNKLNRLIEDFKAAGGQGIEVVNQPRHCSDINAMADRAERHGLCASLGSDFHSPEHTWRGLGWLAPMPKKVTPVWELFNTPLKVN